MTAAPFDVCGRLPEGTTVLEASAGTGKTFTIAALAVRYVAEGQAQLNELLLVTFGRAATRELRERVRERLVGVEQALADPGSARDSGDSLVRLLADGTSDEVALRRQRIAVALADFDAATIDTTHAFCQHMLTGLGIAADDDPGGTFVENIDDIVVEVVEDLYVRRWDEPGPAPALLPYEAMLKLARLVVGDAHAELEPAAAAGDELRRFATDVRAEVSARKRRRGLRDFDDLLARLQRSLTDPVTGEMARARIRSRYRVVMVDEFQDTDPVQWAILETLFHEHVTLVLIGDPKQSIYAFRGGDVTTYLAAREQAGSEGTLARNWRSDAGLVAGLDHVFGQAALGHPRIVAGPVEAEHQGSRLVTDRPGTVRVRVVTRQLSSGGRTRNAGVRVIRELVAADLARDIVEMLTGGARLKLDGREEGPVRPGDIAVLVGTNLQAAMVHAALIATGVPAVLSGTVSVFSTPMALQWLVLLRALDRPNHSLTAKAAALTQLVGWDAARVAAAGDDAMDELGPMLSGWAHVLRSRGVPALLEAVTQDADVSARLLARTDGERLLTDLRHIAESLHAAVTVEHVGSGALVEWLNRQIQQARPDAADERSRRLESDADAVQVVTVHRSKGLEFPITYVPFAWDRRPVPADVPRFHTEDGTRSLYVAGDRGDDFEAYREAHAAEEAGEDLREAYVALTRAQCQVVTWWAASPQNTASAPLHRLLFGGHEPGEQPDDRVPVLSDDRAVQRLTEISHDSGGQLVVESVEPLPDVVGRWHPPAVAASELSAATFDRSLDRAWRRVSYTALTAAAYEAAHEPSIASEAEGRILDDEPDQGGLADVPAVDLLEESMRSMRSPMADLPGGTSFGIVVHSVLEQVDNGAPDLGAELVERSRDVLSRWSTVAYGPEALGAALLPVLETPMGPFAGGRRLRDVAAKDRLAELDFELPLVGGDAPAAERAGHAPSVRAIAALLRERLSPDDPFAPYPALLDELDDRSLRGYLVGGIDLVLRLDVGGRPRYLVVDYKTNWLGSGVEAGTLSAWHYRPAALADAMLAAHYPLQLLLYVVGLHRYLRWRQPGYDPDVHLGGGLYLFLRGMCGPDTPAVDGVPCGVFGWQPPAGLVEELSRLLAGGSTA